YPRLIKKVASGGLRGNLIRVTDGGSVFRRLRPPEFPGKAKLTKRVFVSRNLRWRPVGVRIGPACLCRRPLPRPNQPALGQCVTGHLKMGVAVASTVLLGLPNQQAIGGDLQTAFLRKRQVFWRLD